MADISLVEWFGYLASVFVAVSLMMSSILRIRWINLIGAGMLSVYGFMIGSLPVGLLNLFIALTDIYYLFRIYYKKEKFSLLEVRSDSEYLIHFVKENRSDILNFNRERDFVSGSETRKNFFILRDSLPAGVIIADLKTGVPEIILDYALPQFRDLKLGMYFFTELNSLWSKTGLKTCFTVSDNINHIKYLKKIGFTQDSSLKGRYNFKLPAS